MQKTCIRCNKSKDESLFSKNNGYTNICKVCSNEYARIRANKTIIKNEGKKTCTDCEEEYDISEFGIDRIYNDGRKERCKICYNAYRRRLNEKNKKEMNIYFWNRRAAYANKGSEEKLSGEELMELYNNMEYKICRYCGVDLTSENIQVEHNIPKERGGKNIISNISFTCNDCNFFKLNMTDEEFMEFLINYVNRIENYDFI